jgi:hypothetical protein
VCASWPTRPLVDVAQLRDAGKDSITHSTTGLALLAAARRSTVNPQQCGWRAGKAPSLTTWAALPAACMRWCVGTQGKSKHVYAPCPNRQGSSVTHPEVHIRVEDFCLEPHSGGHQRVLLRHIDGQLKGASLKGCLSGALRSSRKGPACEGMGTERCPLLL